MFFSFNLRNYIFESTKKRETTSFSMTSFHGDLKEAAKCADITIYIASLLLVPSHTRTKYKKATIFGLTHES